MSECFSYQSVLPPAPAPKEIPATWDDGIPRMCPAWLRKICMQSQGFETPSLNSQLSLQYKGIRKIEGLEEYTGVKSMFLDCNGISKIENLEALTGLVQIYLQQNCIEKIENLHCQVNLVYLNLAQNNIKVVENLSACRSLETLNLASNKIVEVESLQGLTECPSLKSIDVSQNYIEDGEAFMNFWPENTPNVECLYLHHNTCSSTMKNYRRRMISGLPNLRFLDQRPCFDLERVGAEAWALGGRDAELLAQQKFYRDQQAEKKKSFNAMTNTQAMTLERVRSTDGGSELRSSQPRDKRLVEAELNNKARVRQEIEAFLSMNGGHPLMTPLKSANEDVAEDAVAGSELSVPLEEPESVDSSSSVTEAHGSEENGDIMATDVFTWSGLRDRRLGRLVAANHYNMQKAAAALSQEFMHKVSAEECRRRYTELKTWQDSGEPTEAAKKDASKWWLRQLELARASAAERKEKAQMMPAKETKVKADGDKEEPSLYYDLEEVEKEIERAQLAADSTAKPQVNPETSCSTAATASLLSSGPSDPDLKSLNPAKAEPSRIPRAFAPPQRGGKPSELGDLD